MYGAEGTKKLTDPQMPGFWSLTICVSTLHLKNPSVTEAKSRAQFVLQARRLGPLESLVCFVNEWYKDQMHYIT